MQDMSQSSAHRHHAIDYVELTVSDLEQAKRFYSEAFGWRFSDYGPEYAGIQSPQGASAPEVGGLSKGQEVRSGGPFVLLYSTDLDRSVEAVKHAGGQAVDAGSTSPTRAGTNWASGPRRSAHGGTGAVAAEQRAGPVPPTCHIGRTTRYPADNHGHFHPTVELALCALAA
jgi:predicted enzyme related to lactoylglutathione lyase